MTQPTDHKETGRATRVAVLALSPLAYDSRVQRCARLLHDQGYEVCVIAQPPAPQDLPFELVMLPARESSMKQRARLLMQHGPANLAASTASSLYWFDPSRRQALDKLRKFSPDIVIANDWNTLPLAGTVKRETGARVIYDSHEFATAEFEERLIWRLLLRNHIRAVERQWIGDADAVFTVSDGIAEALQALYRMPNKPTLLRNVPDAPTGTVRPTARQIKVLFHGLLRPNRGLEALIDSLPAWQTDRTLIIRGYGSDTYRAALSARAARLGIEARVSFEPAVSPTEVIAAARSADIGIFVLPSSSRQNRFALPNKIFEYISACLALVVTPLPEMKTVVDRYGCGLLIGETPADIAAAINGLNRRTIDRFKAASKAASSELNWRVEGSRLLDRVAELVRRSG